MALSHSLAWALLYSLWQGLLIFGFLYVLLKAIPSAGARLKYNLSLGAFVALFAWFAYTWVSQYYKLTGTIVYITTPSVANGHVAMNTVQAVATPQADGPVLHSLWPGIERYYSLIILMYAIGLLCMLFRFLVNMGRVHALRSQDIMLPSPDWAAFVSKWQARFNISRPVKLFLSARTTVPVMLGALKPVILLPVATLNHLSTEQVEAILLHELAHIRRHDYLLNILQTIGEVILFFNPFVWLISAVIRRERELCCDDLVVENAADPLPYARALAILESNRQENKLALAATGNKNQLFNRIKRIMEMKKNNLNNSQLTIVVVAILALTFIIAMLNFTPSFAQKAKKTAKSDTTVKSTYRYKTVIIDDKGNKTVEEHESDEPMKEKGGNSKVIIEYSDDDEKDNMNNKKVYTKTYVYDTGTSASGEIIQKIVHDAVKISGEVANAMNEDLNEADLNHLYSYIDQFLADMKLDTSKIHNTIEIQIQKELANAKKEIKHAKKEIVIARKELEQAEKERKNHRKTITREINIGDGGSYSYDNNDFETMLDEMAGDKLIDKTKAYVIRKAGSELFINGKKQPNDVYEKYSRYLKYKTVDIKGKEGTLNINIKN